MEGSQHGLEEIREDYPEQVGEALKCLLFLLAILVPVFFFRSRLQIQGQDGLRI